TLFDGRYKGASEEVLGRAYERQMRGYFDAFRAMVCVFYGFNSSKETFWGRCRELLQGQALPRDMSDRDAFFAFTAGYGVNASLVHEATQHFGHVALNRIRDMCVADAPPTLHLNDAGAYGSSDLSLDTRPRLNAHYETHTALIPVPESGRVAPISRVE